MLESTTNCDFEFVKLLHTSVFGNEKIIYPTVSSVYPTVSSVSGQFGSLPDTWKLCLVIQLPIVIFIWPICI